MKMLEYLNSLSDTMYLPSKTFLHTFLLLSPVAALRLTTLIILRCLYATPRTRLFKFGVTDVVK